MATQTKGEAVVGLPQSPLFAAMTAAWDRGTGYLCEYGAPDG